MTTTQILSGVEHNRDKVRGFAVYIELKSKGADKSMVSQILAFSEIASPINGDVLPFQVQSRISTDENPARAWREQPSQGFLSVAEVAPSKTFIRNKPIAEALDSGLAYFEGLVGYFDAAGAGAWEIVGNPLVIEVSEADAMSMHKGETPRGLHDRLTRLRAANNMPELPKKGGR